MVKWPKTPPFHGGNPGSSPGGVTNGRLAQLGERLPYKQDVGGSIPSSPTKPKVAPIAGATAINGIIAQLGERLPYKQDVTGSSPVGPTN